MTHAMYISILFHVQYIEKNPQVPSLILHHTVNNCLPAATPACPGHTLPGPGSGGHDVLNLRNVLWYATHLYLEAAATQVMHSWCGPVEATPRPPRHHFKSQKKHTTCCQSSRRSRRESETSAGEEFEPQDLTQ